MLNILIIPIVQPRACSFGIPMIGTTSAIRLKQYVYQVRLLLLLLQFTCLAITCCARFRANSLADDGCVFGLRHYKREPISLDHLHNPVWSGVALVHRCERQTIERPFLL